MNPTYNLIEYLRQRKAALVQQRDEAVTKYQLDHAYVSRVVQSALSEIDGALRVIEEIQRESE